jgi:hypothetical protein
MDRKVSYKQCSTAADAYEKACAHITPEYIEKFQVKAEVTYDKPALGMQAKGKGFTLNLSFNDSGCEVSLDVSFLLKPIKGKVLDRIERELAANI